jgi:hypothetical protein
MGSRSAFIEILKMVSQDSFPRFAKSALYTRFVEACERQLKVGTSLHGVADLSARAGGGGAPKAKTCDHEVLYSAA